MEGVAELAEEIFHMPVRIACPQNVRGLADVVRNPIYSTGVSLLLYGMKYSRYSRSTAQPRRDEQQRRYQSERQDNERLSSTITRIKGWLKGNF